MLFSFFFNVLILDSKIEVKETMGTKKYFFIDKIEIKRKEIKDNTLKKFDKL